MRAQRCIISQRCITVRKAFSSPAELLLLRRAIGTSEQKGEERRIREALWVIYYLRRLLSGSVALLSLSLDAIVLLHCAVTAVTELLLSSFPPPLLQPNGYRWRADRLLDGWW